jgi:hypothetical protein
LGDGTGVDVVVEGGAGGAEHDSLTDATGNFTGNEIDDNGVPGGTSTVNVNGWPPSAVTVIVH